jgi:SAM-dependent methyltransferase
VSRWSDATGGVTGRDYAARFDELAATGADVHGEASFCAALVPAGARVLDAGCGTGRVGIRLAELGYDVTGVDLDESMLAVARERAPQLRWLIGDLATVDLGEAFDLVLMAGNIVPLVADGSESTVVARMAAHVATGGLLVAGFGLDRAHLPPAAATVRIEDYDAWCASAGLTPAHRFSTWNATAYTEGSGYAVSVHAQPVSGAG